MREAAEHDMRHGVELADHRVANIGVVIAVTGGPPARDPIDELAAVGEGDARTIRADDRKRRRFGFHLGVRQPDMRQASGEPIRRVAAHISVSSPPGPPAPAPDV